MITRRAGLAAAVLLGSFALYLHSAGPSVIPYRDAGEMASSVPHLGVLHPTSYPVYSLVGRAWEVIPFANPAYRLNVLSAVAMACTWLLLFLLLSDEGNTAAAAVTVLWAAASYEFWWHATVSEMYTLNLLFLVGTLWCARRQQWLLAAFLFGVGLANRSDLLLTLPTLIVALWPALRVIEPRSRRWLAPVFIGVGLVLYVYLPLRAGQRPWLNWDDPSTLERFIRSIFRLAYGGTLDLLSTSYSAGENFTSELMLYVRHWFNDLSALFLPVAVLGAWRVWSTDRVWFWATLTGFAVTGPVFIWMGNLPPNPHAVAIMEAAYLVPDLFLLLWISSSLAFLFDGVSRWQVGLGAIAAVGVGWIGVMTFPDVTQRNNFLAEDYLRNVYHTMPAHSVVFARSDVPLFSLFYGHYGWPRPPERIPIAQGLASAPWYQHVLQEYSPGLTVLPVRDAAGWKKFNEVNGDRAVFATTDTELSPAGFVSDGVLWQYGVGAPSLGTVARSQQWFNLFYRYRGEYRYGASRGFFSNELVEAYAHGAFTTGLDAMHLQQWDKAEALFVRALAFKPLFPEAAFNLAFLRASTSTWTAAEVSYAHAVALYEETRDEAQHYHALPEVQQSYAQGEAQALAQWGLSLEHLGRSADARSRYERALALDPTSAEAHYNMAVLYWKLGDWSSVVTHLQAMAAAHPDDLRWKPYLSRALEHLQRH